jgi:hypothetical protein
LIPNFPDDNFSLISNLSPSGTKGSHWVCVVRNGKNLIYFDSYGRIPPEIIKNRMENYKKYKKLNNLRPKNDQIKAMYNDKQLQPYMSFDYNSFLCGYYCVYVILEIEKGNSFKKIIDELERNNPLENDQFMRDFFEKKVKQKK